MLESDVYAAEWTSPSLTLRVIKDAVSAGKSDSGLTVNTRVASHQSATEAVGLRSTTQPPDSLNSGTLDKCGFVGTTMPSAHRWRSPIAGLTRLEDTSELERYSVHAASS